MKKFVSLLLAAILMTGLTACGNSGVTGENNVYAEDGYAEGGLGDVMNTYFFTYTVNSAYVCEQYESYVPEEGFDLLVAEISVKNISNDTITMYDTDFQVQWGDDTNDDAFDVPITYYVDTDEIISDDIFPYEYELKKKESKTGLLVFEVPEGRTEYSISYMEYFSDDTSGDTFFVYFTAEKK